ncbi:UBX domain-containing protein 2B [Cricetulus griseus]|uniref:UBX domain-containing protein 2B n=1 Tax=Cricetulus griseus TaxID=10029 RepID=G3HD61_CRIGR|nr:UBX domain-containing protein 2B [Cricetulus griseus]ERE85483.1 UBX domain-containing protein 2B-like protein [Cricetulus griseus]
MDSQDDTIVVGKCRKLECGDYLEEVGHSHRLALAGLYEDEVKCKSSKPDKSTAAAFKSPRTLPHRLCSGEQEYGGLHIVQPPTGKIVNELFKEAREHGAVPLNEATRSSSDDKPKSFTGGGYRLGSSFCKRSEYIYGENQLQDVQILLKLWSNGFSLDDGELRPYNDPTNAQFLESVKRGEIPLELQRLVHGSQVSLDMEDHQDQEYIKPRLRFKAFSGEGQKLGSLTPEIVSTPSSPEEEDKSILNVLNAAVLIDDSVPTTKVQIRLADGSRLIQRFNSTHRILDVRDFIIQSRPEFATTDFILVTSFPSKELTDENLTLQEADILNTVILQQLK